METILFGVIGFTVVILALVLILMAARAQLVQSGDVTILINGTQAECRFDLPDGSRALDWRLAFSSSADTTVDRRSVTMPALSVGLLVAG